jgi:hypothetical protein
LQNQVNTPIVAALSDDWRTTTQIAKARGATHNVTLRALEGLLRKGLVKCLPMTTAQGTVRKWRLAKLADIQNTKRTAQR